jgi:peroxiredoxin
MLRRTLLAVATVLAVAGASSRSDAGDRPGLVGNPAPDFTAKTVHGGPPTVSIHAWRGNVVIVDFWGTFCGPCKKSFPKLETLSERYAGDGLRVVGISEDEEDDKAKIPAFAYKYGAKFALAWDGDKSIAHQYDPAAMPSTFIIDRRGVVRFVHAGFHDGEEAEIEKEVRSLLGS